MPFDQTVPNENQTVGAAFESARGNDVALKLQQDTHAADADAHGLAALRAAADAAAAHRADQADPHGIASIRAQAVSNRDEVTAARGIQASLAARLAVALRNDGGLRLDAVSARWVSAGDSPVYASAYQFTVPGDRVNLFIPGALLRLTVSGDYAYALVASRAFATGNTTVSLDPAGPAITAGLSKVELGMISYDYAHAAGIAQLNADLGTLGARVTALASRRYQASYEALPTASVVVMRFVASEAVLMPAGLVGSASSAETAATGLTTFSILKNGVSVGQIQFAAAGTVATFVFASDVSLAAGDVVKVVAPASPDATLKGLAFNLKGIPQ